MSCVAFADSPNAEDGIVSTPSDKYSLTWAIRDVPLERLWFFGLAVLNRVSCPKPGIVLRAERLNPDCEQSPPFLSLRKVKLKEHAIEHAIEHANDDRRVSFPDFQCLPDTTMLSINIRSFSGQEYYYCRYPLI